MAILSPDFERNVFINCPFDDEYAPIFEAIVFAVHDAGFLPKCARERLDSSEIRLHKIVELIRSARFFVQCAASPKVAVDLRLRAVSISEVHF